MDVYMDLYAYFEFNLVLFHSGIFLSPVTKSELIVDTSRGETLQIYVSTQDPLDFIRVYIIHTCQVNMNMSCQYAIL
jgi:hypothetical protein